MARNWIENSTVVQNRLDEYKVQRRHTRRSVLVGIAASSVIASAAAIGAGRLFPPDLQVKLKLNIGTGEPGVEVNPEERRKASLKIFRDFVSIFVHTQHDHNFWSTLEDFLSTDPNPELRQYVKDVSQEGSLDITWPKDVPMNNGAIPSVRFEHFKGINGSPNLDLTRITTRLSNDGKINTSRESFGQDRIIFQDKGKMKEVLKNIFKLDFETGEWEESEGGVSMEFLTDGDTISTAMNEYGYTTLSVLINLVSPTPKPKTEA